MPKKHNKWLILVAFVLSICVAGKYLILDNTDLLFAMAEGLDQPSKSYYYTMERIYKISCSEKIDEKLRKYLEEGKNSHLHDLYINT